jgi:hypothetical protein
MLPSGQAKMATSDVDLATWLATYAGLDWQHAIAQGRLLQTVREFIGQRSISSYSHLLKVSVTLNP